MWASPVVLIISKASKTMQSQGNFRVVQLPKLEDPPLCPIFDLQSFALFCTFAYPSGVTVYSSQSEETLC